MRALLVGLLLAQAPAIRRISPGATDPGLVTRPVESGRQSLARDGGIAWVTEPTDYATSSFGQQRAVAPYRLADIINLYWVDTDVWGQRTDGGTVAHLPNESAILLTGNAGGGRTELRTHDQFRYQAGVGARIYQTVAAGPVDAGQVYLWGYYDDNDGIYWRYDGSGLRLGIRTSTDGGVTDTLHAVSNGYNVENASIYELAFQWLGVGRVRAWTNGQPAVTVENAAVRPQVYMKTADLPLSYEARGSTNAASLKLICASVQSEGGSSPPKPTFAQRRTASLSVAGGAANVPIISVRASRFFQGQASRASLWPTNAWCFSNSQRIRVDVVYNPAVLTSAAFAQSFPESASDFDTAATGYDGGVFVAGFGVPAANAGSRDLVQAFGELNRHVRRHAFAGGVDAGALSSELDTVTIAITNPDNQVTLVNCGLEWGEVR